MADGSLRAPEPGLDAETLIARAAALRPLLHAQQAEADKAGRYSEEVHQALVEGGLYRIMQPRMFGGYELEPAVFLKVIMQIAQGHPGAGWCYALAASHAYFLAAHWPKEAQAELFGPAGEFRAAHVVGPAGTLTRAEGGYIAEGVWPFASGIPVCTHMVAGGLAPGEGGGPPRHVFFVVPKEALEILPDWGEDRFMGMRASGSNSVKMDKVFVPDAHVIDVKMMHSSTAYPDGTPGTALHGNGMYLGVLVGWFNCEFGAILTGAARAALEEFKLIANRRPQVTNPMAKQAEDPFVQNTYGRALGLADAAEALTLAGGELYMQHCRRFERTGEPITEADSYQVWGLAQQACRLAGEAVEMLFHMSGASAGRSDNRLQRYFRDVEMYRLHIQAQPMFPTQRGAAGLLG